MTEVVLDANVIVALLYADDSLHQRAVDLTTRLENEGEEGEQKDSDQRQRAARAS